MGRLGHLPNPRLDAEFLFLGLSGWTRARLLAEPSTEVPASIAGPFHDAIERRALQEPVQYILGRTHFWRDEFKVTPSVLIPRPDTEVLVELVTARLRHVNDPLILDLGTGSGCIALSLLRDLQQARVVAVDVSAAALDVARENAASLGLENRAAFTVGTWYAGLDPETRFDAIVSNPPYVAQEDALTLAAEVREFEPHLALFADPCDDLSSYRAILSGATDRLKPRGLVAVEVGAGQAARVADLARSLGFEALEIRKDLAGIDRVVAGTRP